MYVTANVWERVVRISRDDGGTGTGTVIEQADGVYVMTARHVLPDDPKEQFLINNRVRAERGAFRRVGGVNPHADVAAFRVSDDWGRRDLPIELTGKGAMLSEDVMFLGYPFGLSFREADDGIPFVKKGALAAIDFAKEKGVVIYYLDGINNPGFSGGPAFLPRLAPKTPKIFGIVHGWHQEWVSLEINGKPATGAAVAANTGIILAYGVEHALEAINASPIA